MTETTAVFGHPAARIRLPPWLMTGLLAAVGSLIVGAAASRHGALAYLIGAALALIIGAMVVHGRVFSVFVGWVALEGLAFPFVRYPLSHDLASLDRYLVPVLGAAVVFQSWPRMAPPARRLAVTFGVFAFVYGLRTMLTSPLPLAPGQLASSPIQPQLDWLQNVGLPFVVFIIAARTVSPERWPRVAKALVVLGVTAALLALLEWTLGFELATISGYEPFYDASAGVVRASGPYPTPSAFGAVMVVCIAATIYWLQAEKAWVLGGAALSVEILGLAPCLTKTVWGAAFVSIVLALGLRKRISSRTAFVAFYAGTFVGVVYTLVQKSPVIAERVASSNSSDNIVGRFATWKQGVAIFEHWPFFGAGTGQFIPAQQFVPPAYVGGVPAVPSPHNTFISVLGETGLVGIVPLLLTVFATVGMIRAYRRQTETEEEVLFGAALVAAATGYFLLSLTFTEIYDPPSTMFLALMLGAGAARLTAIADRAPGTALVTARVSGDYSSPRTPAVAQGQTATW